MDEKSWTGIFVGYAQRSKGYRIFDPRTGRVETSRDVRFSEAENYYPLGNVTQGFEEEGQREILEEVELNSGVTSDEIQESVGSRPHNSEHGRELEDEAARTNGEMRRGAAQ